MTEPKSSEQYETEQTIFRIAKNADNPFVMLDKRPLENPKLSWRAKGLLAYLLSRPDNWTIRRADLIKRSIDGQHSVRGAIKELQEAGHVKIASEREDGKITKWTYTVYEQPDVEFQQVVKPQVENQTFTNNDSTDKESTNTGAKKKTAPKPTTIEQAIFSGQPVTEDMLQTDEQRFQRDAEDAAFLICPGANKHLEPLALAFMLSRHIILSTDKSKQGGHRKALREMYNAKPRQVKPEHVKKAVEKLVANQMTVKDLFSVVGTSIDLANEIEVEVPPEYKKITPKDDSNAVPNPYEKPEILRRKTSIDS